MNDNQLQLKSAEEVQLIARQAEAQFAVTPAGQMLKQFEISQRMGQMFSTATIVPDVYKNNVANCAVAVDMALRMNMPPMMVMQNLYVVHGQPAWSSKFLIACINGCGRFTPLEYRMKDNTAQDADEYGCRCVAYAKSDAKRENPLYGPWVTWKMVKAEGWLTKNGSKWKTMPDLMFRYRAAAMWQRLYAPELAMGFMSQEEAADIQDVPYTEIPAAPAPDPERLSLAQTLLGNARTPADVRRCKEGFRDIYDGDEGFRNAVIERYETLNAPLAQACEAEAASDGEETSQETDLQ